MARPFSNELTPRQRTVLEWIKRFIPQNGMPPTIREIGDAFGIKSSSVFQLLQTLERKGYIVRGRGARLLEVKGLESASCECRAVPILGRIAAGIPLEAIEGEEGAIRTDRRLLTAACQTLMRNMAPTRQQKPSLPKKALLSNPKHLRKPQKAKSAIAATSPSIWTAKRKRSVT